MSTLMLPRDRDDDAQSVSDQIAMCVGPCLQVRVSQRLAELARRPPVPVKISGPQVTEGPALERHLQGLIQQLSSTGEAELLMSSPARSLVPGHTAAHCDIASCMLSGACWWGSAALLLAAWRARRGAAHKGC